MRHNKELGNWLGIDNAIFTISRDQVKTTNNDTNASLNNNGSEVKQSTFTNEKSLIILGHYFTLVILGLVAWGLVWCAFGDGWRPGGPWFTLVAVAVAAWASGEILHGATSLPPLLAALLTGIFARYLGILDMKDYPEIDGFLRKIYPVIILGKGSLAWNVNFMKTEWKQVAALGVIPWTLEVVTVTACTYFLLDIPWLWGAMLGTFYASVSCPVLMPTVQRLQSALQPGANWAQLICTAGGIDTMLSVGVFGVLYSYVFHEADHTYKLVKVAISLVVGVILGVSWGSLARFTPQPGDVYVAPLRVLFVLLGGLCGNFFTGLLGWGGTGGVAVLACNATAATYWARDKWKLNQNPASITYTVLWSLCEPVLFAYTGTYFLLDKDTLEIFPIGVGIVVICQSVRLSAAALVTWRHSLKERMFVCCCWTTKSIVEGELQWDGTVTQSDEISIPEGIRSYAGYLAIFFFTAVLCPLSLNTLILHQVKPDDVQYRHAQQIVTLTVLCILITTPVGFLLTKHLGPVLLDGRDAESGIGRKSRVSSNYDPGNT